VGGWSVEYGGLRKGGSGRGGVRRGGSESLVRLVFIVPANRSITDSERHCAVRKPPPSKPAYARQVPSLPLSPLSSSLPASSRFLLCPPASLFLPTPFAPARSASVSSPLLSPPPPSAYLFVPPLYFFIRDFNLIFATTHGRHKRFNYPLRRPPLLPRDFIGQIYVYSRWCVSYLRLLLVPCNSFEGIWAKGYIRVHRAFVMVQPFISFVSNFFFEIKDIRDVRREREREDTSVRLDRQFGLATFF